MRSKLGIILALLLVLTLDGLVLAEKADGGGPAFNPDGMSYAQGQRRRRRRRSRARRPTTYGIVMEPGAGAAPPEPAAAPPAEEMPNTAPPPPPAQPSDPMDAPGRGRATPAKKSGPRITPPTVQIKPPTR